MTGVVVIFKGEMILEIESGAEAIRSVLKANMRDFCFGVLIRRLIIRR